jgi:hypothetical protein
MSPARFRCAMVLYSRKLLKRSPSIKYQVAPIVRGRSESHPTLHIPMCLSRRCSGVGEEKKNFVHLRAREPELAVEICPGRSRVISGPHTGGVSIDAMYETP